MMLGVAFVVSNTQRTISAGYLNMGIPESFINIPANTTAWFQSGFCPGATWSFAELIVIGNIFHMQYIDSYK